MNIFYCVSIPETLNSKLFKKIVYKVQNCCLCFITCICCLCIVDCCGDDYDSV